MKTAELKTHLTDVGCGICGEPTTPHRVVQLYDGFIIANYECSHQRWNAWFNRDLVKVTKHAVQAARS